MKLVQLVPMLVLAVISLGCCRDRFTQRHLWSEKQITAAIDQDANRQDTWVQKEFGRDIFLVVGPDGNFIKR